MADPIADLADRIRNQLDEGQALADKHGVEFGPLVDIDHDDMLDVLDVLQVVAEELPYLAAEAEAKATPSDRYVRRHAADVKDARLLLAALGLTAAEETTAEQAS